ncbi:MAG: hypothetical protein ABIN91_15260 [Mucilaginibacter sp.]|uniref:hypothetical protein n=1 Tax=Mucilaginibacter sp. TaxID=1882438 RepID=UPI00326794DF
MNKLSLYADPLGDLYVEWTITTGKRLEINLPHYKYEMSNLLGIPVPFASIAERIESSVFRVFRDSTPESFVNFELREDFNGARNVVIEIAEEQVLKVQYVIKNLVNRDKVFFSFVFSLASPVAGTLMTDIEVTARFSYDINSYKLKTVLISKKTGRISGSPQLLVHERSGDFIGAKGERILLGEDLYDLHVHGSRLPFMIDRRIFWLVVFAVALIGIGTLLSIFKIK